MDSLLEKYCSKEWIDFVNFYTDNISFNAKETIFNQGEETKGIYIVGHGKVKVVSKDSTNRTRLVRLVSNNEILGHRGFGKKWIYPVSAIALEKTSVKFIPLEIFNQTAKANTEFCFNLMLFFADELKEAEKKHPQTQIVNQMAKAILYNYNCFGYDKDNEGLLSFTLSRTDYADFIGTTYESVVRAISDLNKEEIIQVEGKQIRIVNLKKLTAVATESDAKVIAV